MAPAFISDMRRVVHFSRTSARDLRGAWKILARGLWNSIRTTWRCTRVIYPRDLNPQSGVIEIIHLCVVPVAGSNCVFKGAQKSHTRILLNGSVIVVDKFIIAFCVRCCHGFRFQV